MQQITASSGCEACNWDCAVGCGEKTERGRKLQELLCRWSRSRPSVRSRSISSPIHLSSILDQRSAPLCCPLFLNCCSVAAPCTDLLHHKGVERPPHPFSAPSTTSAKSIFLSGHNFSSIIPRSQHIWGTLTSSGYLGRKIRPN